jgi:hypothetical protein
MVEPCGGNVSCTYPTTPLFYQHISRLSSLLLKHRQAIDRTHRLGQYRPIRAVRFVAEGPVEERVLQLQEKKRLVFDGTIGRDAGSLKMLTVDDMVSLFA